MRREREKNSIDNDDIKERLAKRNHLSNCASWQAGSVRLPIRAQSSIMAISEQAESSSVYGAMQRQSLSSGGRINDGQRCDSYIHLGELEKRN